MSRRGLKIENRLSESKWFAWNKVIMGIMVKHAKELNLGHIIIAPFNQARISKRMMLPYKLIRFEGKRK